MKRLSLEHNFDGKIGEELVKFEQAGEGFGVDTDILTVIRPDGITIEYFYRCDDLKVDSFKIYRNNYLFYHYYGTDKKVLDEAQILFDKYLGLIKEAKRKEGTEAEGILKEQERESKINEIIGILRGK